MMQSTMILETNYVIKTCTIHHLPIRQLYISSALFFRGSKGALPDAGLTFQQMINMLNKTFFIVTSSSLVRESIAEIYMWLVTEIMKVLRAYM